MISAGRPAVAANAAANAIVAERADRALVLAAHRPPDVAGEAEIEDPARLGEPGPRRLDAHDADRALLERAVDVREADAALVAAERDGPALRRAAAGRRDRRSRSAPRSPARRARRARRRRAPRRRSSSRGWRRRRGRRRAAPRGSRAPPRRPASGARPTLTLKVVTPSALVDLRWPRRPSPPARRTRPCVRRRRRRRSRPAACGTGSPRIWPTRSQTARSTAPRAT